MDTPISAGVDINRLQMHKEQRQAAVEQFVASTAQLIYACAVGTILSRSGDPDMSDEDYRILAKRAHKASPHLGEVLGILKLSSPYPGD